MFMRTILFSLCLFISAVGFSQRVHLDSTYDKVEKETYAFKSAGEELAFDFYRAKKANGKLPLVVFVHGGGFSTGKRDSWHANHFAHRLARRGYAVASVSYRLTMKDVGFGCEVSATEKKGAIDNASMDLSLIHI